jgi:hypothetical protein
MSSSATTYKQAYEFVLSEYQKNEDDRWRIQAISNHIAGKMPHKSAMNKFLLDVEESLSIMELTNPLVNNFIKSVCGKTA